MASFAQVASGTRENTRWGWGLRGSPHELKPGEEVLVHKRDGTTKRVRCGALVPRSLQRPAFNGEVYAYIARGR